MTEHSWSHPEVEVLARAREIVTSGGEAVLATIVDVQGSAYRRPGAKMVITSAGEGVGHVTAGCIESEVVDLASRVLADGESRHVTYDLTESDEDVWGLGVGCNGVITILLEPLDDGFVGAVKTVQNREPVVVVSLLNDESLASRAYYRPKDGFDRDVPPAFAEVSDQIADLLQSEKSARMGDVFIDPLVPPSKALILGTGNDIPPVVELAKKADFHVTVVGFRGSQAKSDYFPNADEVVATSPSDVADVVDIDRDTYAVAMTHNFVDDRLALEALLETPIPYIGLLGPRKRFEEIRSAFAEEGVTFTGADLDRIYTPVGLDLGGGSPYQIAQSIVAELLAVKNDREPDHLREREGTIHERVDGIIES